MSEKRDTELEKTLESLAKGIIAGGALGAVAGLLFSNFANYLFLGLFCGFLAGATHRFIQKRRQS
jgi:hypothetical protein